MTRGRKPKPSHLKLVENARDRRPSKLKEGEPVPPGRLDPDGIPDWFDDEERATWTEALASCPHGLLRRLDRHAFARWVEHTVLRRREMAKLKAGPSLIKTPKGAVVQSPYLGIVNRQSELLAKLESEMGFTPASRTRIALEEEDAGVGAATDRFFK